MLSVNDVFFNQLHLIRPLKSAIPILYMSETRIVNRAGKKIYNEPKRRFTMTVTETAIQGLEQKPVELPIVLVM
jgi:hypothetical protein